MNVWLAADIPQDSCGGVGKSMKELAAGLRRKGHRITILTRGELPARNYCVFALKLCMRYILSLFDPPDWICARSTDAVFCAIVIKLFRLKTGVILHNHGWEEFVYAVERKLPRKVVTNPTTWKSHVFRFPLLRLTLKLSDFCISVSEHEMQSLGKRYPSMKYKLAYIPNGVTSVPDEVVFTTETRPLHFLCIGNVTWKKGIAHSLKVFSLVRNSVPEAELTCIGTGVDDTELCYCTGSTLEGVTNLPSVPFDRMHEWYTACPYMLASSRYEGRSLAILEALSHGIIVFVSAIPSNREIVTDGENGFLITGADASYDAVKIIQKISRGSLATVRKKAVKTARQNSWDHQIERLENLLCRKR